MNGEGRERFNRQWCWKCFRFLFSTVALSTKRTVVTFLLYASILHSNWSIESMLSALGSEEPS